MRRVLIAGMGNVLRRDDGFGVAVARCLIGRCDLPAAVSVVEVGIGGIHLVHELMAGFAAVVVVDAVERDSTPGTLHTLEVEVPDIDEWPDDKRADFLADMHYATPLKALTLAKALGVLPPRAYIVGCQPSRYEDIGIGLSTEVDHAVEQAAANALALAARLGGQEVEPESDSPSVDSQTLEGLHARQTGA